MKTLAVLTVFTAMTIVTMSLYSGYSELRVRIAEAQATTAPSLADTGAAGFVVSMRDER